MTSLPVVEKSGERGTTGTLEVAGFVEADSAALVVGNQKVFNNWRQWVARKCAFCLPLRWAPERSTGETSR